jgi:hypothetical protein
MRKRYGGRVADTAGERTKLQDTCLVAGVAHAPAFIRRRAHAAAFVFHLSNSVPISDVILSSAAG